MIKSPCTVVVRIIKNIFEYICNTHSKTHTFIFKSL
jgi:hypothetical protein